MSRMSAEGTESTRWKAKRELNSNVETRCFYACETKSIISANENTEHKQALTFSCLAGQDLFMARLYFACVSVCACVCEAEGEHSKHSG